MVNYETLHHRTCFAAPRQLWLRAENGPEVESHKATELYILRLVDHTHPAAEFFEDATVRDGLANRWVEILGPGLGEVNERSSHQETCDLAFEPRSRLFSVSLIVRWTRSGGPGRLHGSDDAPCLGQVEKG